MTTQTPAADKPPTAKPVNGGARMVVENLDVPLALIDDETFKNTRGKPPSAEDDEQMQASFKQHGVMLNPMSCVRNPDPKAKKPFILFAGFSRSRNAKAIKMETAPIRVFPRVLTDAEMADLSWTENGIRTEIDWTDTAQYVQDCMKRTKVDTNGKETSFTKEDVAAKLGLNVTRVYLLLFVAGVPEVLEAARKRYIANKRRLHAAETRALIVEARKAAKEANKPEPTGVELAKLYEAECEKEHKPDQPIAGKGGKGGKGADLGTMALTPVQIRMVVEYFTQREALDEDARSEFQEGIYTAFAFLVGRVKEAAYLEHPDYGIGGPTSEDTESMDAAWKEHEEREAAEREANRKARAKDTAKGAAAK